MLSRSANFDTKVLNDKYVVLLRKVLGSGSFATVYKGYMKNQSNCTIAIKMIQTFRLKNKSEDQHFKFLQRELQIQQAFSSSHIVKMIDVIKCDQVNYLILEYCDEGNLANKLNTQPNKRLPYNEALKIFAQIVKGYQELYKEKVIHRDLKPENILFQEGKAKIADFGFAKIVDEMETEGTHTQVGTLLYCAPELMQGLKFCSKADVWSLGCIFYEMLYGRTPFNEYNPQKLLKKITTQPLEFPPDDDVKDEVKLFLKKMLQPNPENRTRWDEIFTNKLMEYCYPQSNTDILSDKSTYVSDEQRFIVHEQQKKQQDEISEKVKLQLQFYANINAFINQTIRQFYQYVNDLKISKETQMLISIASSKYIVIDTLILRSILQNNSQQFQLNQLMALKKINPDEINYLRSNNIKYYEVLNCLNNQSTTLTPFLETLKQNFKKVKQIQNSAFTAGNIQRMEQMLNAEVINEVFIQNYNDSFKQCIKECLEKQKNVLLGPQVSKCIVYLFYCCQPFKFQQQSLEPKNFESNINQLSQKDLQQLIEKLSIDYKLN